ncbi:hypothetical protein [Streptosporangium pseudovulgare]|uniref:DUF2878 domain-containing protein n=1 Tax=Streptosporangium pseudovulgare TaxID=35765 RepID=A0ABQ2RGM0_9ACTN|nr:hypothetical protein [Streptosporangium pseudovulgare]GGQ31253.1 hypothetical protein GCM10010140_71650 [Streptosporangium pseudovulgare]
MLDPRRHYASLRLVALLPLLLFLPAVIAFFTDPDVAWGEYLGVFFHLSILFLVSRLEAAPWAKAAGYGWVTLDVLAGILMINAVEYDTAWAVRLGGHVLAGVWIVASSLVSRSWPVRVAGVVTGVWLAGYSFAGTLLAEGFLRPAGIMILVWFALLAIFHRDDPGRPAAPAGPAPA